jgi:hypothetical protein
MAEEQSTMGIRERMKARRAMPTMVPVELPGLGTVQMRRVTAGEATGFETGFAAVAACAMDEESKPLYESAAAAKKEDWAIMSALLEAYRRVNTAAI